MRALIYAWRWTRLALCLHRPGAWSKIINYSSKLGTAHCQVARTQQHGLAPRQEVTHKYQWIPFGACVRYVALLQLEVMPCEQTLSSSREDCISIRWKLYPTSVVHHPLIRLAAAVFGTYTELWCQVYVKNSISSSIEFDLQAGCRWNQEGRCCQRRHTTVTQTTITNRQTSLELLL